MSNNTAIRLIYICLGEMILGSLQASHVMDAYSKVIASTNQTVISI